MGPRTLLRALNRQLAPTVVVRRAEPAPAGFDARHSATARCYRYLVHAAPVPDPLLAPVAWHVEDPLDLRAMDSATDAVVGEHDFRAFCRRAPGTTAAEPIVRRVTGAGWSEVAGPELDDARDPGWDPGPPGPPDGGGAVPGPSRLLRFEIEAGSFCHQMVRSLVATLVDAGRGGPTRPPSPPCCARAPASAPPSRLRPTACAWWPCATGTEGPAPVRRRRLAARAPGPYPGPSAPGPPEPWPAPPGAGQPDHAGGPPQQRNPDVRTYSPKAHEIERAWHLVDADGLVLGRLATEVARILRGKHRPYFAPHVDTGDHVVVVNASKVVLTGNAEDKFAYRHSGYPGGLRRRSYAELLERSPDEVVRRAVRGMLPKNTLGRQQLAKLKVYPGAEHPHAAQEPQPLDVPTARRPG